MLIVKPLALDVKVEYISKRTMSSEPQKKYLVFISHSHLDSWVARQIASKIENEGMETFLDQEHIKAGEDFEVRILQALHQADELLVLFTPWAQTNNFVWMEIGVAWHRRIPIVPVLYGLNIDELITQPHFPITIKKRDMIHLKPDLSTSAFSSVSSYFSHPVS